MAYDPVGQHPIHGTINMYRQTRPGQFSRSPVQLTPTTSVATREGYYFDVPGCQPVSNYVYVGERLTVHYCVRGKGVEGRSVSNVDFRIVEEGARHPILANGQRDSLDADDIIEGVASFVVPALSPNPRSEDGSSPPVQIALLMTIQYSDQDGIPKQFTKRLIYEVRVCVHLQRFITSPVTIQGADDVSHLILILTNRTRSILTLARPDFKSKGYFHVTDLSCNPATLIMNPGESTQLLYACTPTNARQYSAEIGRLNIQWSLGAGPAAGAKGKLQTAPIMAPHRRLPELQMQSVGAPTLIEVNKLASFRLVITNNTTETVNLLLSCPRNQPEIRFVGQIAGALPPLEAGKSTEIPIQFVMLKPGLYECGGFRLTSKVGVYGSSVESGVLFAVIAKKKIVEEQFIHSDTDSD